MKPAAPLSLNDYHEAILEGQLDRVKEFLEKGFSPNQVFTGAFSSGSAINLALSRGHVELVKHLLNCDVALDPDPETGITSLMHVCMADVEDENSLIRCTEMLMQVDGKMVGKGLVI